MILGTWWAGGWSTTIMAVGVVVVVAASQSQVHPSLVIPRLKTPKYLYWRRDSEEKSGILEPCHSRLGVFRAAVCGSAAPHGRVR